MTALSIQQKVVFTRHGGARKRLRPVAESNKPAIPRVSRLMALPRLMGDAEEVVAKSRPNTGAESVNHVAVEGAERTKRDSVARFGRDLR